MKNAVGILGGVGPLATVYFMDMLVKLTDAKTDQEHINMLVSNHSTIPDRTAYITGESDVSPEADMVADAVMLEEAGCTFIVIPCNTAHYFFESIEEAVEIPVLNIIKETIRYAVEKSTQTDPGAFAKGGISADAEDFAKGGMSAATGKAAGSRTDAKGRTTDCLRREPRLGILATEGTISSGTYSWYGAVMGVECVAPDRAYQDQVNHIIYDRVKAGREVTLDEMMELIDHMRGKGCDAVIMGCTELSVAYKDLNLEQICPDVVDSLTVLARKTIVACGKKLRQ